MIHTACVIQITIVSRDKEESDDIDQASHFQPNTGSNLNLGSSYSMCPRQIPRPEDETHSYEPTLARDIIWIQCRSEAPRPDVSPLSTL